METGANGPPGQHALKHVKEDIRSGPGDVTPLLLQMGGDIARGNLMSPGAVTLMAVSFDKKSSSII